jgi:NitT/TauT family transport system substrate-binding protein
MASIAGRASLLKELSAMLPFVRWISALAVVAGLVLMGGNADAQRIKLKVGTLKQSALTNAWVAKQAGLFETNGLDVELVEFRSGNEAIAAQRGGHVDIVLSIPGTAMTANERGFELVLIAQNETAKKEGPDSGALIVLNDSGIDKVADLAGKKIAISNLHSQYHVAVQMVLKKNGVDPAKVQFLEVPFASQPDALKSKQIDAVASLDPWTTQLRNAGYAKVLAWDYVESIPEQPIGAWYVKADFAARNRDTVTRFANAIRDAVDYMHADADRARRNVAAYTGLDLALLKDMPLNNWSYRIDPAKWQAVADMMHASGELQKPHKSDEYLSDIVRPFVVK